MNRLEHASKLLLFPLTITLPLWLVLAVPASSSAQATAAESTLPAAATILDRFVEVTGGKAAYEKLHNQVARGVVEFVEAGMKGTITAYQAEPDKAFTVIEIEGIGKIEEGTDGKVVWERSSDGPRIKTGRERAESMRDMAFNARLRWREIFKQADCVGVEEVEGKACYKVILTPAEGSPVTQYYDRESGLLAKSSGMVGGSGAEMQRDTYIGDYRDVGGILVPHELRHKVPTQEIHVHLESVQFNSNLASERFDLPPDIRALIDKLNP